MLPRGVSTPAFGMRHHVFSDQAPDGMGHGMLCRVQWLLPTATAITVADKKAIDGLAEDMHI